MKEILNRCLIFVFPLLFSFLGVAAQSVSTLSDISPNDPRWIFIYDFPKEKLPQGVLNYVFHVVDSNSIELYAEVKREKLQKVKTWTDQCLFNVAKGDKQTYYQDDQISLCSQLSYKETSVCCVFASKGSQFDFVRLDISDEDADYVYKGDSLLFSGDIIGAVEAFEKIIAPSSYMDITAKGLEIIEAASPLAQEAYEKGNYKRAALIMEKALSYEGLSVLDVDRFHTPAELEKYQKESWKYDKSIKELLETYVADYSLYLFKAERFQECANISLYLTGILTDLPSACLQWADALYAMGKPDMAKQAYKMYIQRMINLDRAQEIPDRARQRSE